MNQERIRLMELFLDDDLDIRETEQVFHLLDSDADFREEMARVLRMRGLTESALHADPKAAELARRVTLAIGASKGAETFETRVMEALGTRKAARRARRTWPRPEGPALSLWIASAFAAAGFLLVLSLGTKEPARVPPTPAARRAPVEGPRRQTLEELADLEAQRRREMETRLAEMEKSQRKLEEIAPAEPSQERRNALARIRDERLAIEQELRDAVNREKEIREDLAVPPPAVPPSAPPAMTAVAAAVVDRVEGTTVPPLQQGQPILAGQRIETSGSASALVLKFTDGTRLELAGDTKVRELFDRNGKPGLGKRLFILQGTVTADVAKQPADQQMAITTPQSETRVVGTSLRISVSAISTRVDVTEGKVRMTRLKDMKTVDIVAGFHAIAASGASLVARPIPVDEIVLPATKARRAGAEWKVVKDDRAVSGEALECRGTETQPTPKDPAADLRTWNREYLEFQFQADANKDYVVWVRGSFAGDQNASWYDQLSLETPGAMITGTPWTDAPGVTAFMVNGHGTRSGYWWIGGNADANPAGVRGDAVPLTLRFSRTGVQTLRLRAWHRPIMMRVDALWLSATQKSRPEDGQQGPASRK